MSEFDNLERVGVTTRTRARKPNASAPNTVSAAVAALLGATSPAAATPRPFRVTTMEVRRTEWRAGVHPAQEQPVVPTRIDDDVVDAPAGSAAPADLRDAVVLANVVLRALPVDDEIDREVTRALNKRPDGYVPRKLSRK